MAQPVWITPAGSLGVIPEGVYYQQDLLASTEPLSTTPTCTATSATTNTITCSSTAGVYPGLNVMFSGTVFGGVDTVTRYFVLEVVSPTQFKISETEFSTTPIALTTATGTMTATFTQHVLYTLQSGTLPQGVQVSDNGSIVGVPLAVASIQGVPTEVSQDVTSKFTIRAYTTNYVNGVYILDAIRDRTFTLTITGNDVPDFTTPAGSLGEFYDSDFVSIQIGYTNQDPDDTIVVSVAGGELPGGLTVSATGLISGHIEPPPNVNEPPGYDLTPIYNFPYDFVTSSINKNYEFTLEISDGKSSNLRTFTMFVYDRSTMTADDTTITADDTFVTADETTTRYPFLVNASPSDLGRVRSDNYFAYQFIGNDYDTPAIEYAITVNEGAGLPPGLTLDATTGWLYGYIPDQGVTEITYSFNIQVYERDNPSVASVLYPFTLTISGAIDAEVTWITDANLGTIENGATSLLKVEAVNRGGRILSYRLKSGAFNELPQGLELLPSGEISGRVSFNTFAVDLGYTTFDRTQSNVTGVEETTFDSSFTFTVNAYAEDTQQILYEVDSVDVIDGGIGYSTVPTITFNTPIGASAVAAEVGNVTVSGGAITSVPISESGAGYTETATYTIVGAGSGANLRVNMHATGTRDAVSVFKTFRVRVFRAYNAPYQNLYIQAMPPMNDRELINSLLNNENIFVPDYIFRPDDPYFGKSTQVKYEHAYGLAPDILDVYVESLYLNHYWKNLVLGSIETAQALDADGNVIYEVVYSKIVDNLVNADGASVSKVVNLPYPIIDPSDGSTEIRQVYPNSLINMRDQVIDTVGQISTKLPLWMTSKQTDGRVLGFTPAWVLCYTNPGKSRQIAYYIQSQFGTQLNRVDFKVDRYVLDRELSRNWDTVTQDWTPAPSLTTFDRFNTSGFIYIGQVDIGTDLAYSDVNERPLSYINNLGGLDGEISQINGSTLIFVKQQDYNGPPGSSYSTANDAWQEYLYTYDSNGFDQSGTEFDESVTVPGDAGDSAINERMAIYTITVDPITTFVTLTLTTQTEENQFVQVTRGSKYRSAQLYYPGSPGEGLTLISWLPLVTITTTETTFDEGSMAFEAPVDMYDPTDAYDKYLVFPKTNILV